uniref:Zinc finger protein 700 n=1 Tax=Ceratitis capitata TaxID=7213 RepID=W8C7S0_CERCA
MSLLTKDNAKEHCRTCLKRLSNIAEFSSEADDTPDNKELQFNISSDVELRQLISIYEDDPCNNNFPENVCLACYNKLHSFVLFRKKALQNAEKLRTVLNCSSGMIKVEITYDEDESEPCNEPVLPPARDNKQQFKDALMENEEVFFETSAENMADEELNDDEGDPFAPSAPVIPECTVDQSVEKVKNSTIHATKLVKKHKYKCSQCNQSYAFNSELEAHVRQVHDANKMPFSCSHCDKAYRYIRSLQEHMKQKHQAVLNAHAHFKCSVCPKAFISELSLKKHMCLHIKEDMARVCGICSKRFPVKNLLVEHLRTHSNDGRIPCGQCDKSFLWYQDLLNHERSSHLKEKPFPCKLCDKSFQTQKSLRFHSYRHSGEKPYLCDVCGKDFRQPTAMKQHRLKHFKIDKDT